MNAVGILTGNLVLCGFVGTIVLLVATLVRLKKDKNPQTVKQFILALGFVIIAAVSWIFNLGWFRVILTFASVPFIHSATFIYISTASAKYVKRSKPLRIYTLLSYITYIISYLFFADFGDVGPTYVFFGLIHNDVIADNMMGIAICAFLANIVFMIMMVVKIIILKKAVVTELCEIEE